MGKRKRNKAPVLKKECESCDECVPIGEGDFICTKEEPKIVLSDYIPTEEYGWCKGRCCNNENR